MSPAYSVSDARSAAALACALGASRVSRIVGHRGVGTAYKWLRRVPGFAAARCRVEFMDDCVFDTEILEPYWGPTVVGGRPYEPELEHVLRWLAPARPTFVDCGANFGFWSIVATSRCFGFPHAVAIEANPLTFRILEENRRANGGRFVALCRAVASESGEIVRLAQSADHAVAHVASGAQGPQVTTISIDDAVHEAGFGSDARFFLKIDVEGHEIAALDGSRRLRATADHVLCVEDFADNDDFATVRHLLQGGYDVFHVSQAGVVVVVRDSRTAARSAHAGVGRARNFFASLPGSEMARALADRSTATR